MEPARIAMQGCAGFLEPLESTSIHLVTNYFLTQRDDLPLWRYCQSMATAKAAPSHDSYFAAHAAGSLRASP